MMLCLQLLTPEALEQSLPRLADKVKAVTTITMPQMAEVVRQMQKSRGFEVINSLIRFSGK